MDQDDRPTRQVLNRRNELQEDAPNDEHREREITPTDGSVAGSGSLVCVFCAPCQRWIDCYDDIPPEVARARHGQLFH